jgi:hypothetical protein
VPEFDRDHDDRLSDVELCRFRDADIRPAGGPRCDRPENPRRRVDAVLAVVLIALAVDTVVRTGADRRFAHLMRLLITQDGS